MDKASTLKSYYDKLVQKHKKLIQQSKLAEETNKIDLPLALDLKVTGEKINEFSKNYGRFIRRRNSSYGRFQVDSYTTWLQGYERAMENYNKSGGYNINEERAIGMTHNNNANTQFSNLKNVESHVDTGLLNNEIGAAQINTSKRGKYRKKQTIANELKESKKVTNQNMTKIKKESKTRVRSKKKEENEVCSETKKQRKKRKNNVKKDEFHNFKLNTFKENNNYYPMINEMNNDKKKESKNVSNKIHNSQENDNIPYSNFFVQNTHSSSALSNYNNAENTGKYIRNEQGSNTSPRQHLNFIDHLNMQKRGTVKPDNFINTNNTQKRKFHDGSIQYINLNDVFQRTMQKNNKQKNAFERKNMSNSGLTTPSHASENISKDEICKIIEPNSLFKNPIKEDDELSMGRYIYKVVYNNENPTEEELSTMNEMYDVYLETICHTSCMIAKANNKNTVEPEDVKLAIKLEYDVKFPDDVTINPITEMDNEHEKKMAMIAKETQKRNSNK